MMAWHGVGNVVDFHIHIILEHVLIMSAAVEFASKQMNRSKLKTVFPAV